MTDVSTLMVQGKIDGHIKEISSLFKNGHVTVIIRNPDLPKGTIVMSQESTMEPILDAIMEIIEDRKALPALDILSSKKKSPKTKK